MRDVALQSAVRFKAIALVVLSVFAFICAHAAHAQNPMMGRYNGDGQIPRELMRASAKRAAEQAGQYGTEFAIGQKFNMPPLPGEQAFADSAQESEKYQIRGGGQLPDYGPNGSVEDNISLPPLVGLRQVLDSEVTKKLLKDLTVAKTNVLMQTYMMVENGAATGFMGGMGIGSDLMSNMLAAQDAQMKMLDVVDYTGRAKAAYVRRVAHLMREGDNKNIWPAAIYMASGENGEKPNVGNGEMKDLTDGRTPYNFQHLPHSGNNNDPNVRLLSDLVFNPGQGGGGQGLTSADSRPYSNDQIDELKQEFVKLVGNTKLEIVDPDQISRKINYTYIAPQQDNDGKRRGVAAVNWEEVKVVWTNIHNLIADRCEWKKRGENSSKEVFDKASFCSTKDAVKDTDFGNPWELASAPDIPMTCDLVDKLFTYIEKNASDGIVDCNDDVRLTEDSIPELGEVNSSSNFNECSGKNGCERKRLILNIAFILARSRTLHTYKTLEIISKRFAVDPNVRDLVDLQFARSLSGMDINAELIANRQRYADVIDYFGRLVQGAVGTGNNLRPGTPQGNPGEVGASPKGGR